MKHKTWIGLRLQNTTNLLQTYHCVRVDNHLQRFLLSSCIKTALCTNEIRLSDFFKITFKTVLQLFCGFFVHWLPLLFTERKQETDQVLPVKNISQHFYHCFSEACFWGSQEKTFLGIHLKLNLKKNKLKQCRRVLQVKSLPLESTLKLDTHFRVYCRAKRCLNKDYIWILKYKKLHAVQTGKYKL